MKNQFSSLAILCLFTATLIAQPARPTLTTEDVMKWRAANPDKAEHYISQNAAAASQRSQTQKDAAFLAAEKDWNARLSSAREKVRNFERLADQAEIAAAQTRNVFMHADPSALNANNARVAAARERARFYRAEARQAQEEVNSLLDEGNERGYQISYLSPVTRTGEPNLEYYRTRFLELQTALQDAQAEAAVGQLQVNRVQTAINANQSSALYYPSAQGGILFYPNNGAGDVFHLNRLRNQLSEVGGDLNTTQNRIAMLMQQLEELREQGRKAGVPPGIFR